VNDEFKVSEIETDGLVLLMGATSFYVYLNEFTPNSLYLMVKTRQHSKSNYGAFLEVKVRF